MCVYFVYMVQSGHPPSFSAKSSLKGRLLVMHVWESFLTPPFLAKLLHWSSKDSDGLQGQPLHLNINLEISACDELHQWQKHSKLKLYLFPVHLFLLFIPVFLPSPRLFSFLSVIRCQISVVDWNVEVWNQVPLSDQRGEYELLKELSPFNPISVLQFSWQLWGWGSVCWKTGPPNFSLTTLAHK